MSSGDTARYASGARRTWEAIGGQQVELDPFACRSNNQAQGGALSIDVGDGYLLQALQRTAAVLHFDRTRLMDKSDNRVIDIGTRLKIIRKRDDVDLASERIRNLAYQATKLPTTLSKSEIEELGFAVLTHMRRQSRIN